MDVSTVVITGLGTFDMATSGLGAKEFVVNPDEKLPVTPSARRSASGAG